MNKTVLISIVGVVIVAIIGFFMIMPNRNVTEAPTPTTPANNQPVQEETMQDNDPSDVQSATEAEQLGGTTSPYYAFTADAYEEAINSDKLVFLEFYANWCPTCRVEQPDIVEGFNQLERDDVVGFRANFKDSDTDAAEDALAQQLGVTYQHTKIIFKDGEEVLRDGQAWDTDDFLDAIDTATN